MKDLLLVRRLLLGDHEAFDCIYEKYSTELYRTAYLMLRNQQDAEDAVQETFVKLWRRKESIRKPESLRFWLLRSLSDTARDALRRRKREVPEEEIQDFAEQRFDRENGDFTAEVLSSSEMENILSLLTPNARRVVVLYYFNELSVKEIAQLLGQPEGTVKSRLFHARQRLKQAFLEEGLCREK